jgi:hypothetical protein
VTKDTQSLPLLIKYYKERYPNPLSAFSKLKPLPQSYMSFDAGVQLKVLSCRFTTTMRLPVPVAHTAIKLPDFWVKDAKMWFSQAAAQFFRGRECAKYDKVLNA